MPFYELTDRMVSNISLVLDSPTTVVKAADAAKVVAIRAALKIKRNQSFYELGEGLCDYLIDLLENITIQGKFSFALVEIFVALGKPQDKLPEEPKGDKKTKGPPSPKGSKVDGDKTDASTNKPAVRKGGK